MLNFIEKKSVKEIKQLVIFLHGYGSNKQDLMGLQNEFTSVLPNAHFISVDAPFNCETGFGLQWFSLNDRSEFGMYKNLQPATIILDEFINQQLTRFNLNDNSLILIGFSQGTMMALHTAPRRLNPCTIIGFSGMIVCGDKLQNEAKSESNILLIHGDDDQVVPAFAFNLTIDHLIKNNMQLEHHLIKNLAHNINYQALKISKDFLGRNFTN